MNGFEPQTSGIGSDRSANWATTLPFMSNIYNSDFGRKNKLQMYFIVLWYKAQTA